MAPTAAQEKPLRPAQDPEAGPNNPKTTTYPTFRCGSHVLKGCTDFRSIPILKTFGWPVAIDATHSVQMPGKQGDQSGGDRSFAKYMMRCGMVCGADVVFAEVHNDPDNAPSDGPNMLHLDTFENFVKEIRKWFDASPE